MESPVLSMVGGVEVVEVVEVEVVEVDGNDVMLLEEEDEDGKGSDVAMVAIL